MPNYIVKQHIDDFLKTKSLSAARNSLEVPKTSDFQSLCTTVQSNSATWAQGGATTINSITGVTYTLAISDAGSYVRKYYTDIHYVIIPLLSPGTLLTTGNSITVRNTGLSSLTLSAASTSTVINYDATYAANIVEPKNTAQLLYLGDNNWDII